MEYVYIPMDPPAHRERWRRTDYYCPICGTRAVWEEEGAGDYYAGPSILCIACGGSMQHPSEGPPTGTDVGRIAAIHAALAKEVKP